MTKVVTIVRGRDNHRCTKTPTQCIDAIPVVNPMLGATSQHDVNTNHMLYLIVLKVSYDFIFYFNNLTAKAPAKRSNLRSL